MNDAHGLALLDANILIYAEQANSPYHAASKSLRDHALTGKILACVSPQVLNEFYAIVTSPSRVEVPMTAAQALDEIGKYCRSRRLVRIFPGISILDREIELLGSNPVIGPDIHDLHLAATMLENGVSRIYTYNARDFAHFREIEVLTPPKPEEQLDTV